MKKTTQIFPTSSSQPLLHQHGRQIQPFGTVRQFPLGLSHNARLYSCQRLNQLLADMEIPYAFYKKHHWLMRGATFYQLHLLLDKRAGEQIEFIDTSPSVCRSSAALRVRIAYFGEMR
jgi:starvation-inducible DNA-binding protein